MRRDLEEEEYFQRGSKKFRWEEGNRDGRSRRESPEWNKEMGKGYSRELYREEQKQKGSFREEGSGLRREEGERQLERGYK